MSSVTEFLAQLRYHVPKLVRSHVHFNTTLMIFQKNLISSNQLKNDAIRRRITSATDISSDTFSLCSYKLVLNEFRI